MRIENLLVFVLLATLCTESLSTREPVNLLNTTHQLSRHYPFIDLTDHHIATAHLLEVKNPHHQIVVGVKTYSLKGQELTSCNASLAWPDEKKTLQMLFGGITSLGNNETLVIHWINKKNKDADPTFTVSVVTLNTSSCKFTVEEILAHSIGFEREYGMRAYVVPYKDSFDVVFGDSNGKIVRTRFEANGLNKKNATVLVENESSSITRVDTISKYSESKGFLAIYHDEDKFTAVSVNSNAKSLKRQILQLPGASGILFDYFYIYGEVDHGKLVFCKLMDTVSCQRYNATTLENEISTEIDLKEPKVVARILVLPDGGFWIWTMQSYGLVEDDEEEYEGTTMTSSLTKVNADGRVEETFENTHCRLDLMALPRLYTADGKICVVYLCEGSQPSKGSGDKFYSTQLTCY